MGRMGSNTGSAIHRDHDDLVVRLGGGASEGGVGTSHGPKRLWRRGSGRRAGTFGSTERSQRVAVKVYVSRHRKNGKATLVRHASYLMREGVGRDEQKVRGYSADQTELDLKQQVKAWAADRHHFRIVISPENAHRLTDLRGYTRRVMTAMERDLGSQLEWFSVDHYNTRTPHSHVIVRGREASGDDLVISRDYIARGLRDGAQQVATDLLGPRSDREVYQGHLRDAVASRTTRLDWALDHQADQDRTVRVRDLTESHFVRFDKAVIEKRLAHLRDLGLAEPLRGGHWRLSRDMIPTLRVMGRTGDVVKNLHIEKEFDRGRLTVYGTGQTLPQPVVGRVVDLGGHDERLRDQRFVLVRDPEGWFHYLATRQAIEFKHLRRGSLVSLEPWLDRGTRLRSLSDLPVSDQVQAEAYTWLDRQLYRQQQGKESPLDGDEAVAKAMGQRKAWLVERGYATQQHGRLHWRPGVVDRLVDTELKAAAARMARKLDQPVRWLSNRQPTQVTGRQRGSLSLHSGRYLVVLTHSEALLIPVRGSSVTREDGRVTVQVGAKRDRKTNSQIRDGSRDRWLVTGQDLQDPKRLLVLFEQAADRGMVARSEADRLRFFAAAQYVKRTKSKNAPSLFYWLVANRKFDRLRAVDEDRASRQLKALLHGSNTQRSRAGQKNTQRSRRRQRPELSQDARLVAGLRQRLARAGYRGDPFEALKRHKPRWTRQRWNAAVVELTHAAVRQRKTRLVAQRSTAAVGLRGVRRALKALGIDGQVVIDPPRTTEVQRDD